MTQDLFEPERYELAESPLWTFEPDRRQFLETLGAGLLLVVTAPAQSSRDALETRLHINEDGRVTIFTGKVEEGQGARAELTSAAAEELGIPSTQVEILMADTDLTPSDGTTAGSRTTPSTVPAVRRACAAARSLLTAARQANAAITYKNLARSPEMAKAYKQSLPSGVTLTEPGKWRALGQNQLRPNAKAIVTGEHKFPSDIQRPNMLYGAMLRPPSWGATLASVDASAVPAGVTPVRDGDFVGCVAPNSYLARKAVQALAATARWNEKPHTATSANLATYLKEHVQPGGRNNTQHKGNVEEALAAAGKRMKAAYQTAFIQHAPMEPRAAVAEWQDGKLTVWTGTSNPFSVRDSLAQAFGMPTANVRVIVPDFGGGFGGKHTGEAAIEAARLAKPAGRPVSLRWTRAEEFMWAYARPAALIEVEAALDGRNIAAWDFTNYNSGASAIATPYRAEHSRTRFIPSETPVRQGSYRALASTANNFARESFIDELAAAAGVDPLEFRLANLENGRIREVLVAVTRKFRWQDRSKQSAANRGVGLACGTEKNSVVAACVEVEVDPKTGTPRLLEICEAFECGAILNPAGLRAQVEGCILMGLGAALREELQFANGKLTNGRFAGYRVPRFRDMPKIDLVLVDKKDAEPAGAGETPIIAVAPAMANAIFAATGKRRRSLPLTA
jgi:isoquinoline 1-oxidoreductase